MRASSNSGCEVDGSGSGILGIAMRPPNTNSWRFRFKKRILNNIALSTNRPAIQKLTLHTAIGFGTTKRMIRCCRR